MTLRQLSILNGDQQLMPTISAAGHLCDGRPGSRLYHVEPSMEGQIVN